MGKGRFIKSAERACSSKAKYDSAEEAETASERRYGSYRCPVCHHFHLTSRAIPARPAPSNSSEPARPKLAELDWSALQNPKEKRPPSQRTGPEPVEVVETAPKIPVEPKSDWRAAVVLRAPGKDHRALLNLDGRMVKSTRCDRELRLVMGQAVWVTGSPHPTIVSLRTPTSESPEPDS